METLILNFLLLVFVSRNQSLSNAQINGNDDFKLPDYIAPCYRNDPMLSECVRSTIYGVIRKLKNGIPELGVPPIEPLYKDEIEAFDVAGFSLKIKNISLRGASELKILWNSASAETNQYSFQGEIESLQLNANYELTGFFLFIPVQATGTVYGIGKNIEYNADVLFGPVPKNGIDFVEIRNVNIKVFINDGSLWISNLGLFEVAINKLLNNRLNTRFMFNHIAPIVEDVVPYVLEKFSNRIFNKVPYDLVILKGTGPFASTAVKPLDEDDTLLKSKKLLFLEKLMTELY